MSKLGLLFKNESARFLISSIFFSLVLCLIFSAFVKGLYLNANAVNAGRTVIKIISVLSGAIYAVKRPVKGAVKGLLWGIGYCLVSFVLFSLLAGSVDFAQFSFKDLIFGAAVGFCSGIIAVNVKK